MTDLLLNVLRNQYNVNTVGFYIVKNLRRMWDLETMVGKYKDWNDKQTKILKLKFSLQSDT